MALGTAPADAAAPAPASGRPRFAGGRAGSHGRRQPPWMALAAAGTVAVAVAAVIGWRAHWVGDLTPARPAAAPAASASPGKPAVPSAPAATSAPVPRPVASGAAGASAPPAQAAGAAGPAGTVASYFAAISHRDYQQAWQLGGRNSGPAYAQFVSGLSVTATDTISDVSVSGGSVSAFLTARHTDGSVRIFRGSYTVTAGVITRFDVRPVG